MTNTSDPPSKNTEQRVYLMRPIALNDSEIVTNWYQQVEDVSIFDRQVPLPINQNEVRKIIESMINNQEKEKCRWFIAETEEGTAVGMTGLEGINLLHGHAIIPLFIAEPWRRSGIGFRMACMMIDLAFKQMRLHRIATVYRSDNKASEQLLDRLGFHAEGISRQSWFSHGQYFDLMNVGLLKEEWAQVRPNLRASLSTSTVVELGPRASSNWRWPGKDETT